LPEKAETLKESEGKRSGPFALPSVASFLNNANTRNCVSADGSGRRSQREAATGSKCVVPLISKRGKTIESRFKISIEQLRNFASTILEMETSVKGTGTGGKSARLPGMNQPSMTTVRGGRTWWRMPMVTCQREGGGWRVTCRICFARRTYSRCAGEEKVIAQAA
jgi:hypothetical protein